MINIFLSESINQDGSDETLIGIHCLFSTALSFGLRFLIKMKIDVLSLLTIGYLN
jgi:hypothetical protein